MFIGSVGFFQKKKILQVLKNQIIIKPLPVDSHFRFYSPIVGLTIKINNAWFKANYLIDLIDFLEWLQLQYRLNQFIRDR